MTAIHDTADLVSKALRRAWQLGQTYWMYADSEYESFRVKADATQAAFDRLDDSTREAILTSNSGAQPATSAPDGYKLVPIEPTRKMLDAGEDTFVSSLSGTPTSSPIAVYRAMLNAAPESKP